MWCLESPFYSRSRVLLFVASAIFCVSLAACSDGGDELADASQAPAFDPNDVVPPRSDALIPQWLTESSDYSIFVKLLAEASLDGDLFSDNDGNEWTVFAPTDAAFDNFDLDLLDDTQRLALPKLHIYSGLLESSDLAAGELAMVEGNITLEISSDGKLTVGGSTIVARDRRVANGIIHVIGAVMTEASGS